MRGDGRVYQRGRVWWLAYCHQGREYRESSRSTRRSDAVRLLRQRIGALAGGSSPAQRAPVFMAELFALTAEDYRLKQRTSSANKVYLGRLQRRYARFDAQGLTGLEIRHYVSDMQRLGRSAEAINREMAVLRRTLRLGYEHDLLSRIPKIPRLPEVTVRQGFFSREEVARVVSHLPSPLHGLVWFAYFTGWRRGEILGLRWSNVDRVKGVIRLAPEQNKSRDVRVLALQGELRPLIEREWKNRAKAQSLSPYVFNRSADALQRCWRRACQGAGLPDARFHDLRRSAVRNMVRAGLPERVIMSVTGHKSRAIFDRYHIVTEADQQAYLSEAFGQ